MISGILIFNSSAELIISRFYKSDYSRIAAEAFRIKIIQSKNYGSPAILLDKYSFMYIRKNDLIIVAMSNKNSNINLVYAFLYSLTECFKSYFDGDFSEEKLRSNFVLIYELFDEVCDNGYPQIVDPSLLQQFIHHGKHKDLGITALQTATATAKNLAKVTGATPWRENDTIYSYKKNEVYLDVIENVNVIINQNNNILNSHCSGKIIMKCSLSGMPICKFGLNDKVSMQQRRKARGSEKKVSSKGSIALQDVRFHQCVKLSQFAEDKTIMFIPPDGEFQLMSYRINKTNLPFDINSVINERGRTRIEYLIKVTAKYEPYNVAQDIHILVPVPENTSKVNVKTTGGKTLYQPIKKVIDWSINKLAGGQSITLKGDVLLIALITDKQWSKPPISMKFTIPMWPASGLKVRFLNVQEPKLNYKSIKWVRYITHAGDYQIRI